MLTQHSMFKTPEGQARYLAAYDATLALWPVPVESVDVPTRFGNTHVNACGPEGAPPLLLLHAFAISSTMWYPNVAELSRSYRIYALDTIGDKGKSVSTRPILPPLDFVTWLSDVFDELRLEQAHVAGLSFGGFLALNLALSVIPAALAVAIYVSHRKYLTMRILTGVPELTGSQAGILLTEGIYSRTRHPRYVESILWILGYALFTNYLAL